jgi:hypothetical protein
VNCTRYLMSLPVCMPSSAMAARDDCIRYFDQIVDVNKA